MFILNIFDQSLSFLFACAVVLVLVAEGLLRLSRPWAIPALVGYLTIAGWYLLEPLYLPEPFTDLRYGVFDAACFQVIAFLLWLRFFIAVFARFGLREVVPAFDGAANIPASQFLYSCAALWLVLLIFGVYRLEGDLVGALFPTGGRAVASMWSRGAAESAGGSGFLVSSANYFYTLVCSAFGILLPFLKQRSTRLLAVFLISISWPYFLLQGSRNIFLAIFLPTCASYLLYSRQSMMVKAVVMLVGYMVVDFWFQIVIAYRDVGFASGEILESTGERKHLGLNMMSELCYINTFDSQGILNLSYGMDYLAEVANAIPRAIWSDKPLIGIDYAILRGFAGGDSDIGVVATISSGIIGQGYLGFGPVIGPAVAALLFAIWIGIVSRFRQQQESVLRLTLFLLGLGLTFNLGRNFTMLVFWPIVFGYVMVRILEMKKRSFPAPDAI